MIRPATPDDLAHMVALERDVNTAAHWRPADYARIFEPSSLPRVALVLEAGKSVTGFLVASAAGDEWEIENVVVAADARMRGLGSKLVRGVIEEAARRRARAISLEVRESNHAARSLYEKCAFEVVGQRRSYYRDPAEDAVIYRLKLPSN